jgi:hypothetical protein
MSEIIVNEVAEKEEVELNTKVEDERKYDDVMGYPPDDVPYIDWIRMVSEEIREGASFMVATEEQMKSYDLGYGNDEAEDEMEKMASSDDEELFPTRSWSDGVWIVTPSEHENERFWPHSE